MGEKLTVALFGYYSYGNLGDNLMAYLLSRHIKTLGHQPIVFTKSPEFMAGWDVELISDITALINQSDVIVFGGGGLLIPRRNLSSQQKDFNDDLGAAVRAATAKGIPQLGISLGGAGKSLEQIAPIERHNLVRALKYVTLRNSEDVQLLEQAGIQGAFHNDMVWTTADKVPVSRGSGNGRRRIGFNLYLTQSRRYKLLRKILQIIVRLRPDLDFVFLEIHPGPNGAFKAFAPKRLPKNCTRKTLADVEDACREAASLDLLVSTRLHLGVMTMSYGGTTIAYAGQEKTRLLYKRIGRESLFWESPNLLRFLRCFLLPGALAKTIAIGRSNDVSEGMRDAHQHYVKLTEALATIPPQAKNETHDG
ncbi:polysaccharide pyruvyl transferase family protein [Roseicyclus sp. F158]|uniref:Polysaccharide pyruvyl transferase family protein n=1 Tax=Tropicimonas omnivorans TaxID=3075590 RepID=A0ABU3DLE2_9RHOB|nr:polysaccharide pyruvyl transferase family protein [Roseicyclus sp. F158]MDT0684540.1 polysaccharide pyruvyl transferase family protein [Roseicyclus sp. F158]